MTLIKFGAIVVDGRGKLGGHVLSKNRSGNYMRTKVTPANPQTVAQQQVRAALGSYSAGWSGLTQAQRDSWDAAAEQYSSTNVFGDSKSPTGKNLYTGINIVRSRNQLSTLTTPVAKVDLPSITVSEITVDISDTTGLELLVDHLVSGDYTDVIAEVHATPSVSPGTSFVKNQYRYIGKVAGADLDGQFDVAALYEAHYGLPVVGQKVYVKIVPVSTVSGQQGTGSAAGAIVTQSA